MDSYKLLEVKYHQIAESYLEALQASDLKGILSLFDPQGVVISPVYGQRSAQEFYELLFKDTQSSETKVLDILTNPKNKCIALYFQYKWTLSAGKEVSFECVDLMRMNHEHKIASLRIIYDTHPIRPYLP